MLPKSEFPPLLKPGFESLTLDHLRALTVDAFPGSTTRAPLWDSLKSLVSELRSFGLLPVCFWIDGSFLTEKIDPDDIDLCIEIDADRINASSPQAQSFLHRLANHELHGHPRKLHTFLIPSAPPGHPDRMNYLVLREQWKRDFGVALISREPKGIALLEVSR